MKARISDPMWIKVFGTDTIPVAGPPFKRVDGLHILVDVVRLTTVQRVQLATKFARSWRIGADRVMKELLDSGSVPIPAKDVQMIHEEAVAKCRS